MTSGSPAQIFARISSETRASSGREAEEQDWMRSCVSRGKGIDSQLPGAYNSATCGQGAAASAHALAPTGSWTTASGITGAALPNAAGGLEGAGSCVCCFQTAPNGAAASGPPLSCCRDSFLNCLLSTNAITSSSRGALGLFSIRQSSFISESKKLII